MNSCSTIGALLSTRIEVYVGDVVVLIKHLVIILQASFVHGVHSVHCVLELIVGCCVVKCSEVLLQVVCIFSMGVSDILLLLRLYLIGVESVH